MAGEEEPFQSVETWVRLAEVVRDHEQEVQADWLNRAKRRPATGDVPDSALRAHIDPLLRWFAAQVGPPSDASIQSLNDELADARPREGIDDGEAVAQFSILRDCLLRAWGAVAKPEQSLTGMILVHRVIDACVTAAVERCVKTGRRALDAVESVSLDSFESSSLGELLQRLLETFQKASFAVDGAVILLLEGDHLRRHASIGFDSIHEVSLRIGEGFAGRIAAEK